MKMRRKHPDFVRVVGEFSGGKNTRCYYAFYGKKKIKITKRTFDRHMAASKSGVNLERKQGSKKGAGETPGAGHCWPLKCEALACHPSQVEGFKSAYKKRGVNVDVRKDGMVIVPDEGAYRRLRKVHGAFHRNSFNG